VKRVQKKKDQMFYAAKIIKTRDNETTENIIHEFINISKLKHENIVSVYELLIDKERGKIYTYYSTKVSPTSPTQLEFVLFLILVEHKY
jgi:hypothetical protein